MYNFKHFYYSFSIQVTNEDPHVNKAKGISSIIETRTDELLFTNSGRRALKVFYFNKVHFIGNLFSTNFITTRCFMS